MLSRRGFLYGASGLTLGALCPGVAWGSQSRALRLDELVHRSQHSLVGTPTDMFSQWETIGRRRRIVTYSVLQVDHVMDARPPKTGSIAVRTLGGRVGDIGQVVHGEAILRKGRAGTLFLTEVAREVYSVTAMAQGHYPLRRDDEGVQRLKAGAKLSELVGIDGSAVKKLDGRSVPEAERLVVDALHGR